MKKPYTTPKLRRIDPPVRAASDPSDPWWWLSWTASKRCVGVAVVQASNAIDASFRVAGIEASLPGDTVQCAIWELPACVVVQIAEANRSRLLWPLEALAINAELAGQEYCEHPCELRNPGAARNVIVARPGCCRGCGLPVRS